MLKVAREGVKETSLARSRGSKAEEEKATPSPLASIHARGTGKARQADVALRNVGREGFLGDASLIALYPQTTHQVAEVFTGSPRFNLRPAGRVVDVELRETAHEDGFLGDFRVLQ